MGERARTVPRLDETVLVPAGPFCFGENRELRYLPPFRIDRYPVTVARYAEFVRETGHAHPGRWPDAGGMPDRMDHPVTGMSWFDAMAFARWAGRTLPTEEQWEKAARGTDERAYPWGERFSVRNLNSRAAKKRGTTPVTMYPDGASPFGVVDMCGNVWEWTNSWFDGAGDLKVLKGGSYALTKEYAAIDWRHYNDPAFGNNLTGFRTVEPL
jgi:formylglycine-generating enzyme required for sulfatase activity